MSRAPWLALALLLAAATLDAQTYRPRLATAAQTQEPPPAALSIDQTSLASGTASTAGSRQLTASGGAGGNEWTNNGAGSTLNDADGDCAFTSISADGLVEWTSSVAAGTCSFTARVTDDAMTSDTQAFALVFNAGGAEAPWDYWDDIFALPDVFASIDFRVQAEIDAAGNSTNDWSYDPMGDGYSNAQDAMKLLWPESENSFDTGQQLRIPINQTSGDFLVIWDAWWGPEWRPVSCGGGSMLQPVGGLFHKEYQFALGAGGTGSGDISIEPRNGFVAGDGTTPFSGNCAYSSVVDARSYNLAAAYPTGTTDCCPLTLSGLGAETPQTYPIAHSTWTRNFARLKLNQPHTAFTAWNTACSCTLASGTYHMYSYWVFDETRALATIYYEVPIARVFGSVTRDGLSMWWFEMNTSDEHHQATGSATFTGTNGAVIPKNTVVERVSDGARYTTQAAATIAGGTAATTIKATAAYDGPIGNAIAGTDFVIVTPIANVDTAFESGAITGGQYMNAGPLVAYFRGAAVLRNYALPATPTDDTAIFKRPVR